MCFEWRDQNGTAAANGRNSRGQLARANSCVNTIVIVRYKLLASPLSFSPNLLRTGDHKDNYRRGATGCSCSTEPADHMDGDPTDDSTARSTTSNSHITAGNSSRKSSAMQGRRLFYFEVPRCRYTSDRQQGAYGASRKLRDSTMTYCRDATKWMEMVCNVARRGQDL